jgi:hypothetical protein
MKCTVLLLILIITGHIEILTLSHMDTSLTHMRPVKIKTSLQIRAV